MNMDDYDLPYRLKEYIPMKLLRFLSVFILFSTLNTLGGEEPMPTLVEGKAAPTFTLPANHGKEISLKDYQGKNWVILYFYPKDDTPGCTKEACSFRDNWKKVQDKGAVILGISRDNLESHKKFIEKYQLPFLLLSDEKEEVCKKYEVLKEKTMFGKTSVGIERSTFIIDKAGNIKKIFRNVKVDGHTEEVLKTLE